MTSRSIIHPMFMIFAMLFCGTNIDLARAGQEGFPYVAQVVGGQVNVRAGQSANFERVCQLKKGDEVLVVDKQFSWYKVRLPASANVFVSKQYVQYLGQNAGGINADNVNMRAGVGIHFTVLGQLNKGEQIYLEEDLEDWYRIRPVSNSYGWVVDEYLAFKSSDISGYATTAYLIPEAVMNFKKEAIDEIVAADGQNGEETVAVIPRTDQVQDEMVVMVTRDEPIEKTTMDDISENDNSDYAEAVQLDVKEIPKVEEVKEIPKAVKVNESSQRNAPKIDVPENGLLSAVGFVELYELQGEDGIYYKIVREGEPVCYVQGPNQMLGRFIHQKVTVNGAVNQKFFTKYNFPVITVSKIRLMI